MTDPQTQSNREDALSAYRATLDANPEDVSALIGLGRLLLDKGAREQAAPLFQRAVWLSPDCDDARTALEQIAAWCVDEAHAEAASGRMDRAEALCDRALSLDPESTALALKIGGFFYRYNKRDRALQVWHHAIALDVHCIPAYLNIGKVLRERDQIDRAIAIYQKAISVKPRADRAYALLVPLLKRQLRYDEALQACERLLVLKPGDAEVIAGAASLHELLGNVKQAHAMLLPVVRRENPPLPAALAFSRICQRLDPPSDEALPLLQRQLALPALTDEQRSHVLRAMAALCDALGRYDAAFTYLEQGKALEMLRVEDSKEEQLGVITRSLTCYTAERMARLPRARHGSRLPIFIVGMPRTGTSLAEQILSCHPQIHGAGELTTMIGIARTAFGTKAAYPLCLDELTQERVDLAAGHYLTQLRGLHPSASRITDKMPFNFLHLGQVELLFPEARIVHCTRDPLDTCVSCYFMEFSPKLSIFQDLATTGAYYQGYRRLMKHWESVLRLPIFTLCYEKLLADPEPTIRALVEFCGVEWDPACLRFYESRRPVKTFSYHQVRKPLYKNSIGRHQAYEQFLGPLRSALGEVLDRKGLQPA